MQAQYGQGQPQPAHIYDQPYEPSQSAHIFDQSQSAHTNDQFQSAHPYYQFQSAQPYGQSQPAHIFDQPYEPSQPAHIFDQSQSAHPYEQSQPAHIFDQSQSAHTNDQPWPADATVIPVDQQPADHVLWSLFNVLFLNSYCFGFFALIYSIKSRDCKVVHDLEGATHFGRRAKTFNVVALIAGVIVLIIKMALMGVFARDASIKLRAFSDSLDELRSRHYLS